MATKQTEENLRKTFVHGINGVLETSDILHKLFQKKVAIISIVVAVLLPIVASLIKVSTYDIIIDLLSLMVNFLPGILGFTIAGYTLVVGFVQSSMMDRITEPIKENKYTLYQKMSGTFAINVIFQAIALIVAFIYHEIIFLDVNKKLMIPLDTCGINIINFIALVFLVFWFSISVLLTIQIVLNIFNFSQLHHYIMVKNKIDSNKNDNSEQQNNS